MTHILVGEVDLLAPILLAAGHLDDGHGGRLDELDALDELPHLLLLQDVVDLPQQL